MSGPSSSPPGDSPVDLAPVEAIVVSATPEETRALGERIGRIARAGDLIVLSGDLGAGKTTLTQGIGAGLQVRGQITSPTFIVARLHPSLVGGPDLVHADAYRISSLDDLETLDLDTALSDAVTVVEWGAGLAERFAPDRLEIDIERPHGAADGDAEARRLTVHGTGPRGRLLAGALAAKELCDGETDA